MTRTRILLIVLACLVLAVWSSRWRMPERPRGGRGQMLSDGEFRGGEYEGGSVFGLAEVIKSLGVIAFVTAGVVLVQKMYARLCKPKKPAAGAQPGS